MKAVAIIFGYNNTRVDDVKYLQALCAHKLGAEILLCKDQISAEDCLLVDYTLEIVLEIDSIQKIKEQLTIIDSYCLERNLEPIACLPFSDRGVPLGSYYAQHCGLPHDDPELSLSCINKYAFRVLEKEQPAPPWYQKPFFGKVTTYEQALDLVKHSPHAVFFKPTSEGNSRGCVRIENVSELRANRDILQPYFAHGVIAEQCIEDCDEYSFDGVNGNYVITEKKTSSGQYRVETQQIMPAPLAQADYDRLLAAGKHVAKITGSNGGAVHHELFFNPKTKLVYCVEPNRRPAGLKFWEWIQQAYPDIDNWGSWIDWAAGKQSSEHATKKREFFVGARMLMARQSGKLQHIDTHLIQKILSEPTVVTIKIGKIVGSFVTSSLKENGDFLGYVCCKSPTIEKLHTLLDQAEKKVLSALQITANE